MLIGGAGGLKLNGTAGEAKKPAEGAAAGGLSGIEKARKKADEALKNADKARQKLEGAKGGEGKDGGEKAKPAEGGPAAPAEGEEAKPAEGENTKPVEGEKPQPAEGENAAPVPELPAGGKNANNAGEAPAGGEKAGPATGGNAAAEGTKAEDLTAVKEGEQFDGNQGITVDRNGNTKNLGGSTGITKGSDGSTSVGGAAGINILSTRDNVAAEEKAEQFEEAE